MDNLSKLFLTSKDLRIGNYINYENTTHVVSELHTEKLIHYWISSGNDGYVTSYKQILSIPLTEKEVNKLGFNQQFEEFIYCDEFGYAILLDYNNDVWLCKFKDNNILKISNVNFVHELQNLYFDLTKRELVYNGF